MMSNVCRHGFVASTCSECSGLEDKGVCSVHGPWVGGGCRQCYLASVEPYVNLAGSRYVYVPSRIHTADLPGQQIVVRSESESEHESVVACWRKALAKRDARIAELETEVAALSETLRVLFRSAAAPLHVSRETPSDAVEFPVNALRHSR